MTANPYDETRAQRRIGRRIVDYRIPVPDLVLQPALSFDPPQPANAEQTIEARFMQFHAANPHIYCELRAMALEDAHLGNTYISVKWLFERLRRQHPATARGADDPYRLNNIYTSRYARMLAAEPELTGRIELRKLAAE